MANRCDTCRFFQPSSLKSTSKGSCRQHAPVIVVVSDGNLAAKQIATQVWPKMYPGDWCGDWQPIVTEEIEDEVREWASDDVDSVVDQRAGG